MRKKSVSDIGVSGPEGGDGGARRTGRYSGVSGSGDASPSADGGDAGGGLLMPSAGSGDTSRRRAAAMSG